MPTPTGRRARQRYCCTACRHAAYRRRHQHAKRDLVADLVADSVVAVTSSRDAVPAVNRPQTCPHCGQQLAVIAVVVPATAAHIYAPEVIPMTPH
jgi:hypothetical protein